MSTPHHGSPSPSSGVSATATPGSGSATTLSAEVVFALILVGAVVGAVGLWTGRISL